MDVNEIQIDESIRPYLNEIAERLWSTPTHAAIMVGAGFSKNANRDFPDWSTLGDIFFEKIHGKIPDKNSGEHRYLNALKLADEVQAAFGRPALDQLLRSNIPDTDSQPSPLHIKLLELPWSDVFTTNYDTLLDRARDSVSTQKFDLVVNKEDLVYSEKPRIIKLHGSFPSERPFIITEEDYRTYPKTFAPFVNTVQQSLLENTLCLIGFSGDDPNFLQWIGWIRDNLGKENAPKIYLIGIINLSEAQKKLLEQRNIVLIDFSNSPDISGDHYKALERFFDYLLSRKKEENRLGWPENSTMMSPNRDKDKITQIIEITKEWQKTRLKYPNWIVLPEDRRESLWLYTRYWTNYISIKDQLSEPIDLFFIFELNWRFERCLMPIFNNLIEIFESIIDKYWPFKTMCPTNAKIYFSDSKYKELNWDEIQNIWLHLSLSMLRFYREEGMFEKWDKSNQKLDALIEYFSSEQKAFLHYERVLNALFKLDIHKVKTELSAWSPNFSIPFWEAKRAGLLAEIGEVNEAERILERSMQEVRSKLNLKPVTTEYSFVSQESILMLFIKYIKSANNFSDNISEATEEEIERMKNQFYKDEKKYRDENLEVSTSIKINEENIDERWQKLYTHRTNDTKSEWKKLHRQVRNDDFQNLSKSFEERWNILKQYKCDPWNEIKLFENQLDRPQIERAEVTENFEFDIGHITKTHHMFNTNEEAIIAYRFLRYFEELGLPFRIIGKKSAEGALQRLSKYSPNWAMITLIRVGDQKVTDQMFNRQALLHMGVDDVDGLIDEYLNILKNVDSDIADGDGFKVENFGILLAKLLPEILSRLCCKCSKEKKTLLFDLIYQTYVSEDKNKYRGISNLLKRLLKTFDIEERYSMIPLLIDIPYPENMNAMSEREYPNPFHFIDIKKEDIHLLKKVDIKPENIKNLFDLALSDDLSKRKWGTFSLGTLFQLDLLTDHQGEKLGEILWSQRDESGFPCSTQYYKFAFMNFPHPKDIDIVALIKEYIENTPFPIQSAKKDEGISIIHGDIPVCNEIIGASRYMQWTKDEIYDLLKKLIYWWNSDKGYLSRDQSYSFGSISEEFHDRFLKLIDVLNDVIWPYLRSDSPNDVKIETIQEFIQELDDNQFYTLRLKVGAFSFLNLEKDILSLMIKNALRSNIHVEVIDALNAILVLLKNDFFLDQVLINELLKAIGQKIYWQHSTGLKSSLTTMQIIIKNHPKYWNEELESLCLQGINILADETKLSQKMDKTEFVKRLEIREATAGLAHQLFMFYSENKLEIPSAISIWKEICANEEEFAEIRVQWIDL